VLFPSVGWEQFAVVLLEAFAAGAPVIARRLGSVAELVGETGAGELFDSASELRPLLERFLANPAHGRELAERGRRVFNERWSDAVVLPRYFQLIREAAVRRGLELERFSPN
jgi:glycosyltransferase involved in cell wall biosynthesis